MGFLLGDIFTNVDLAKDGKEALVKYNGVVGFGNTAGSSRIGFNVGFQIYLPTSKVKTITKFLNAKPLTCGTTLNTITTD